MIIKIIILTSSKLIKFDQYLIQVAGAIRFKFVYNNYLGYNNNLIILNFNQGRRYDGGYYKLSYYQ